MDRIVEVKVNGTYVSKDHQSAGSQGEANATALRIEFDDGWDGFVKTITWWDAKGENPTSRILTADLLEDIVASSRIYLTTIPSEALTVWGKCIFSIDGYINGKRLRSAYSQLVVKPNGDGKDVAIESVTPTQIEQLQVQIDTLLGDMQEQAIIASNAATAAKASETAAAKSEAAAKLSETNAASSAAQASASAASAKTSAETATSKATAAQTSANNAESSATAARNSATFAAASSASALESATAAGNSAAAASNSATAAAKSADTSAQNAGITTQNANTATQAATSAASSAASAYSDATAANVSASNAATSEANAKASETAAADSAASARSAEVNVARNRDESYTYMTNAQQASYAAEDAAEASIVASQASQASATQAANSERNAAASATTAQSAMNGKVSKTGDFMTGPLHATSFGINGTDVYAALTIDAARKGAQLQTSDDNAEGCALTVSTTAGVVFIGTDGKAHKVYHEGNKPDISVQDGDVYGALVAEGFDTPDGIAYRVRLFASDDYARGCGLILYPSKGVYIMDSNGNEYEVIHAGNISRYIG